MGHHRAYYKPRNARLVVAGGFDAAVAREAIAKAFGELPRGEAPPTPRAPEASSLDGHLDLTFGDAPTPPPPVLACVARRAPRPE